MFFAAVEALGVDNEVVRSVALKDKLTQAMLHSVMNWVMKALEDTWFPRYVSTFPQEEAVYEPHAPVPKKFTWSTNKLVSVAFVFTERHGDEKTQYGLSSLAPQVDVVRGDARAHATHAPHSASAPPLR